MSLDSSRTIDLRGQFHCETTTRLSNQSSIAPNSGSAACTGARASKQTATSEPTTFPGIFDLRVDTEGDGTFVNVLPPVGGRASWFIGELERYAPFRLPAIAAALPRTFARPGLAFANPNAAVADRTSRTLYVIRDWRLTAFDAAGNQLRSSALPFTRATSIALSDDSSRLYVGGDDAFVTQLLAADLTPLRTSCSAAAEYPTRRAQHAALQCRRKQPTFCSWLPTRRTNSSPSALVCSCPPRYRAAVRPSVSPFAMQRRSSASMQITRATICTPSTCRPTARSSGLTSSISSAHSHQP